MPVAVHLHHDSVLVRHLQDLLPRVLADEIRVVGRDVRLDALDHRIVGLTLDALATRAMHDLHVSLLDRWDDQDTTPARRARPIVGAGPRQYAPRPRATASGVRSRIVMSTQTDQFST